MTPQQISTGFACWLRYCSDVADRRTTKLCRMFGRLLQCIIFGACCPLSEFLQVQNSLYVQVVHYPIYAALLHGTPAAGVSQTLRRGTRNVITELSQRAPPISGWAAITLGIGPHSSYYTLFTCCHAVVKRSGRGGVVLWPTLAILRSTALRLLSYLQ